MDDHDEDAPSGSVCLHVNTGQIVTPPRGIVQLELVIAFTQLDPWVVIRTTWPADTAGFYIANGVSSDERFNSLIVPDMGSLSDTRLARYLEAFYMDIGQITGTAHLTWTDSEIL